MTEMVVIQAKKCRMESQLERLQTSSGAPYSAVEAAIHVGRYTPILPLCKGRRALDVACGEGYGSWLISKFGAEKVDGVDLSREAVRSACENFNGEGLSFHVADAENIAVNLGHSLYDLIVCIETIEHLQHPENFLKQVKGLMAEGCLVYITCPNDHWYYAEDQRNPFHVRKYYFEEFRVLTESVFGTASRWLFGTAALGFTTVPLQSCPQTSSTSDYVNVAALNSALLCQPSRSDNVGLSTSSYFVGVWNDPSGLVNGGAFFPMSMTAFAEKENAVAQVRDLLSSSGDAAAQGAAQLGAELAALREAVVDMRSGQASEVTALKQQNFALASCLRELESRFAADLAASSARLAEVQSDKDQIVGRYEALLEHQTRGRIAAEAERDTAQCSLKEAETTIEESFRWRETGLALSTQARALRAENDVLGQSVATWQAEATRVKDSLTAEIHLIRSEKDEEIACLRQRIASLEVDLHRTEKDEEIACLRQRIASLEVTIDRTDAVAVLQQARIDYAETTLASSRTIVEALLRLSPRRARSLGLNSTNLEVMRRQHARHSNGAGGLDVWPESPDNFEIRKRLVSASQLFDSDFYLDQNPDVAEAGIDPVHHYLIHGGLEGRRASARFDSAAYLRANPDVAEVKQNPLLHFLVFGAREGRTL